MFIEMKKLCKINRLVVCCCGNVFQRNIVEATFANAYLIGKIAFSVHIKQIESE
jgi:hypothetical protein